MGVHCPCQFWSICGTVETVRQIWPHSGTCYVWKMCDIKPVVINNIHIIISILHILLEELCLRKLSEHANSSQKGHQVQPQDLVALSAKRWAAAESKRKSRCYITISAWPSVTYYDKAIFKDTNEQQAEEQRHKVHSASFSSLKSPQLWPWVTWIRFFCSLPDDAILTAQLLTAKASCPLSKDTQSHTANVLKNPEKQSWKQMSCMLLRV